MDEIRLIEVKEEILSDNDAAANELREKLRREKTFVINLMSSPGAGKGSGRGLAARKSGGSEASAARTPAAKSKSVCWACWTRFS